MSARSTLYGFLLALILLVSSCSKDEMATEAIDELTALTDDIVKTVSEAQDKKAGVAEAQAKLDAKKGDLGPKMDEVKQLRGFQVNEETQAKMNKDLADNLMKMVSLELDLVIATATDPELEAAVDKLIADHKALTINE
jgi:hypothetical protein